MKICFVAETMTSGVGRHVVDLTLALARRGHEIHLVYSPLRADAAFCGALERQPGVHCHSVAMRRSLGPSDLRAVLEIRRYIRRAGPFDLIHGHSAKGGGHARLLKLLTGTPAYYTAHAFITMSPTLSRTKRLVYRVLERLLSVASDAVICLSQVELEHARRLGIAAAKLQLIPNGIDPAPPSPGLDLRAEHGIPQDAVVVGYVGRLDDQKSPGVLIEAASRVAIAHPRAHFVMIGDGPLRARLEASTRLGPLSDRVHWLGVRDGRRYMPSFDLLALPSRYEGFAYVLLEALAAGLPIVATPVGGVAETVSEGVNGFVVTNAHDMTDRIGRLVGDPALRRRMARASHQRAGALSIERMATLTAGVYAARPESGLLARLRSSIVGS